MPGKHSPCKLADRLVRARKRGYLPRRCADDRWAKLQTPSITECGDRPYAERSLWADSEEKDDNMPRDALILAPHLPVRVDPLVANGPWARATFKHQVPDTMNHSDLWQSWQAKANRMDPETPPFVPAFSLLATTSGDNCSPRDKELEHAYNLIQFQNDSIALLMAQLTELRSFLGNSNSQSSGSVAGSHDKLQKVERDVHKLASSLRTSV